jgi:hypothetical protein
MAIEPMPVASLRPHQGNARTHSKKQIRQIAESIRHFGFTNPVLIGEDGEIIAGHGRVEAAKLLGLDCVPTVRLAHLNAAQRRAYLLADNKLALNAGWDRELLAIELQGLIDIEFDVELTGFSPAEIDIVLDEAREGSPKGPTEAEDQVPFPIDDQTSAVTHAGDVWRLGRHRLICGDSRDQAVFDLLMGDERADLLFTDPPYNVPIDGHVTGLGRRSARCPYSIDAICIGSLWCADRTLPRAMPTKNIAAIITAITPSFCGGPSLRICLSKSSWSRRSIFEVPIFGLCETRQNCRCSTDRRGTNIGFLDWGR